MQMLKVKQAAEMLNVSPATIYALCARGKIAHERYGLGRGTIRIRAEAIQEYRSQSSLPTTLTRPPLAKAGGYRQLSTRRLAAAWRARGVVPPASDPSTN